MLWALVWSVSRLYANGEEFLMVEAQTIEGKRYILIPAGEGMEVNGIPWTGPPRTARFSLNKTQKGWCGILRLCVKKAGRENIRSFSRTTSAVWMCKKRRCPDGGQRRFGLPIRFEKALSLLLKQIGVLCAVSTRYSQCFHGLLRRPAHAGHQATDGGQKSFSTALSTA